MTPDKSISCIGRVLGFLMVLILATSTTSSLGTSYAQKEVTLKAILDNLVDHGRWDGLIGPALKELKKRHPDMNINLSYTEFPYSQTRDNILKTMSNQTPIDLLSVDQIWLGDFADKGFLTDLSNRTKKMGKICRLVTRRVGVEEVIFKKFMEYGLGQTLEVYGTGKIC